MTGYLERLIGRVVHGQAGTRPGPAARFAPAPVRLLPVEPSEDVETVVAGPARVPAEPPRSPRVVAHDAHASSQPTQPQIPADMPALAPMMTAPQSRPETRELSTERATVATPQSGTTARKQRTRPRALPVLPEAWRGRPVVTGDTRPPPPPEAATTGRDGLDPAPTFLLPPQPPAVLATPAREQAPSRSAERDLPPVTVRIGRIEVRREPPRPGERRAPASPGHRPWLGLDDYLDQRRRGER